jgi:hypothetical protein
MEKNTEKIFHENIKEIKDPELKNEKQISKKSEFTTNISLVKPINQNIPENKINPSFNTLNNFNKPNIETVQNKNLNQTPDKNNSLENKGNIKEKNIKTPNIISLSTPIFKGSSLVMNSINFNQPCKIFFKLSKFCNEFKYLKPCN